MAYNPFNVFRRNQKTLFAILTIIIMVVFTLSFGAGDFFQWLPTLVGQSGNRGEAVATIDGSKVYEADLQKINLNRYLASDFMLASNNLARRKVDAYISESLSGVSQELRPQITQFREIREGNNFLQLAYVVQQQDLIEAYQNPQARSFIMRRGMSQLRQYVNSLIAKPDIPTKDADVLKAFGTLINLDAQILDAGMGYFGHKIDSEDNLKGALDFKLWLQEADKLGINFSESDAQQLYLEEFYGQSDPKSLAEMEKQEFASKQGYSREMIFKALADEFRVRTVQSVVLGRTSAMQAFATPWDSYEYFRKLCNGAAYAVITVPAENFLDDVKGTPSESELRKLFETYRKSEADPSKDNLGLREPRKLKIGWLEVKGDEPYYKKLGAEALAAAEIHARAFAAALVPLPGGGMEMLVAPAVFNLQDPALAGAYATFKDNYNVTLDTAWFPFLAANAKPLDASVLKPTIIATTAAVAAGSLATHAGYLPPASVLIEQAHINDRVARAKAFGALFTVPTPAGSFLIGSALAAGAQLPPPPPLAMVRTELLEKVKIEAVRNAAERDLVHFEAELQKIANDKDKKDKTAEAKAYIAKFIADRGLTTGESKTFDTQWNIGQDPGLQPLIDKAVKLSPRPDAPLEFGRSFFFEPDLNSDLLNPREKPTTSMYVAQPFPDRAQITVKEGDPVFMTWRTEEVPAETPRDFTAAKPQIMDLWRQIEARKLAEAAAQDIAKQVREQAKEKNLDTRPEDLSSTTIVDAIVSDVYLQSLSRYPSIEEKARAVRFELQDVAPISIPEQRFTGQAVQPRPFQLLPTKTMPYPTPQMQQQLLENKDDKPATTLVLHGNSKDRFYVAVLKHRQDRRSDDFYNQVYNGIGPVSNEVRGMLQNEEARQAFRQAMALLRAEFKVEILNDKMKP